MQEQRPLVRPTRVLPLSLAGLLVFACGSPPKQDESREQPVGPGPDWVVRAIAAPPSANGPFTARITACNEGGTFAPPTDVELYASLDDTLSTAPPPGGDFFIGSGWVEGLDVGACRDVDISVWGAPIQGAAYLATRIDPYNTVLEGSESNNVFVGEQIGLGYGPDLHIQAIQAPPSAQGTFDAQITVCNQGTAYASSANVELYATLDTTLETGPPPTGDFFIGSSQVTSLAPGQCAVATIQAWAPPLGDTAAYLAAIVDPFDSTSELIESNNTLIGPLTGFGYGPDLVIAAISAPPSANGPFTAHVTVCNQGTANSSGTQLELYATEDEVLTVGPPPAGDLPIGNARVDSLAPQQCANIVVNAYPPPLPGTAAYVAAVIDPYASVPELIESNNARIGALTGFGSGPDLVVSAIAAPPSAQGAFEASVTVCNQGTSEAWSANVDLLASTDVVIEAGPPPAGDLPIGSAWINNLLPGQCTTVVVPAWSPPIQGAAYLGAVVDEFDVVSELIESNNTTLGPLMGFGSGPDLVVRDISAPPANNGPFTAQVTVCNQGTTDTWGADVELFASLDDTLDASPNGDFPIGYGSVNTLLAGDCVVVDVSAWTPPIANGAAYLAAVVDHYETIPELIESNNTFVGELTGFGYGPDLIITAMSAPPSASGGFTIGVTVCNQGTGNAPSTQLEVYASEDTTLEVSPYYFSDYLVGAGTTPNLPADQCAVVSLSAWTPPLQGGAYLIGAVDRFESAAELIESNNELVGPLTGFGYGPDLIVTAIAAPPSAQSSFAATITVCNQGTADAPGAPVDLYASLDTVLDTIPGPGGDFIVGSAWVDPILAGQCRSVSTPGYAPPLQGGAYLIAIVDPYTSVSELIESNNTTVGALTGFGYGPDLVVTQITAPAAVDGAFTMHVTVCNRGTGDAPSTDVEVYGSTDTAVSMLPPPYGDFPVGGGSAQPLMAGACQQVTVSGWAPPLPTTAGYLLARIDPWDGIPELIESNNDAASVLTGFGYGPDVVVTAIQAPPSSNGPFVAQVNVCNQGTAPLPPTQVEIYASADQVLSTTPPPYGDYLLGSASVGALNAGQCQLVAVAAQTPPIAAGSAYLIASVDAWGTAQELIESNNRFVGALTGFGFGPDLVVSSIAAPPSASGAFEVEVTICNQGTASASGSNVEIYASVDQVIEPGPSGDWFVAADAVPSIPAGQCVVITLQAWGAPLQGGAYLAAIVDRFGDLPELIESNNTTLGALMGFGVGPDLVIESLVADPYVFPGGPLHFTYTVCNVGTDYAGGGDLGVLAASTPDAQVGPGAPVYPVWIPGLPAGDCASGEGTAPVPFGEGPAYLVAAADVTSNVQELIESNNQAVDAFEVALTFCGNGVLDVGEACDDGNFASGDGCSATCTTEYHAVWQENANGVLHTNISWNYAMGYHFTPQVNGYITAIGGYFNGTKTVRLFNRNSGALLAQATVTASNNWGYTNIPAIAVQGGQRYTVAVYLAGSGGSYRTSVQSFPRTYGDLRIDGSTYVYTAGNASARPTNTVTTTMYGQADVRFSRYP